MALRIEKAFGVKMETLLNMQAWHDAYAMRQREGEIDVKRYRHLVRNRAKRNRLLNLDVVSRWREVLATGGIFTRPET
jgi:plasmid maintenance system antidote protein VapI